MAVRTTWRGLSSFLVLDDANVGFMPAAAHCTDCRRFAGGFVVAVFLTVEAAEWFRIIGLS